MTKNLRIKVIYITGYGRSGTTLMSIALGQHRSIFGAGEISELSREAWKLNTYCSCGNRLHDCSFWSPVARHWMSSARSTFLERYRKAQRYSENLLTMAAAALGKRPKKDFAQFSQSTEELFRLAAAASGKEFIVDSSKTPGRVWALTLMHGLDVYIVHLVRDGRGVAWSLMKSYKSDSKAGLQRDIVPKSTLRTSIRWAIVNLAAEHLQRIVGPHRYVRIRYEDFTADPVAAMKRIGDMIGVNLEGIGADLGRGQPISAHHHQIAGNRLRMSAAVKMEKDESRHSQMPETNKRAVTRICGWMLRRYGYV